MIEVNDLTKQYAGRVAVNNISFRVEPGEIVGFLGPNGAGKSTTMRILSGYMPPTSGQARVNGHDVFADSLEVRRSVGYMPETAPLYVDMRVKEYLRFRGELKGLSGKDLRRRVGEVMELCNVTDVRRRLIANLSKGYRQRVALADALLHKPPLLILDEPTNGLDPVQIRQVRELLSNLRPAHTILLSTHILQEVEHTCDRVIMLHHGRILAKVQVTGEDAQSVALRFEVHDTGIGVSREARGRILAMDTPQKLTQQLRASTLVHLEVQGKGDMVTQLEALPGIRKATAEQVESGWQKYSLRVEARHDVREAVMDLATAQNWKIRELHRQLPSLEDVFVELAASEPVKAGV